MKNSARDNINKNLDNLFYPTFKKNFQVGGNSISLMPKNKTLIVKMANAS
jgi:hypothetical protein